MFVREAGTLGSVHEYGAREAMPIQSGGQAPYAPAPTITTTLESARQRGFPSAPFSTDVLKKIGVSDALAPRALVTLKILELIDEDGRPTETFERLRKAPEPEYKQTVAEVIRTAYAEVFEYKDPNDPNLRDAFRDYLPHGQQDRMVTLFTGLCQYAEIIEGPPPKARTRQSSRGTATTRADRESKRSTPPKPPRNAPDHGGDTTPDRKIVSNSALERYVDLLLTKAADDLTPDLLDRIERALGIPAASPTSARAPGQGDHDGEGGGFS